MSVIGYSTAGYSDLAAEIRIRKQKILDILNSFPEVQQAISESWRGEDATAYSEELAKVIQGTIETVTAAYDTMAIQFERTYNDWIEKQRR